MKGSKHNDGIKEKAFALLASGESVASAARALGLSYSTVRNWNYEWSKEEKGRDKVGASAQSSENDNLKEEAAPARPKKKKSLEELREEMKKRFVKRACNMISDTQKLLERRIKRAVHKENVLDEILSMVEERKDKLSDTDKEKILHRIESLRLDDVRALSSILATLWDKQALAMKEPTINISGGIRFEDL